jgi:hypothetical protein
MKKILAGGAIWLLLAILFLEMGSRFYQCPGRANNYNSVLVCDPGRYPVDPGQMQTVQSLSMAERQGTEPSREDLERVVNFVDYEDMPGLNGVACGNGMLFVRDNLGGEAKYFVARHELEHAFRRNGVNLDCSKEEYCATMSAARIYPAGFMETIFSSLAMSARESPTIWCFLFGSWRAFRAYVLVW